MKRRVKTGIRGFDYVVNGGFLEGTVNMVTGGPGAGKTIFALNYILKGADMYNENGLFITFEETWKSIRESMSEPLLKIYERTEDKINYLDLTAMRRVLGENYNLFDVSVLSDMIKAVVENNDVKRVAIDGISSMALKYTASTEHRNAFFRLGLLLKDLNVTTVLTAEEETYHEFPFKEYLADSITHLIYDGKKRRLQVVKMRGSDFVGGYHGYKITDEGFIVYPRRVTSAIRSERREEIVSTGIKILDAILGGGYNRGDIVFVIGCEGTGKTTIARHFVEDGSRNNERTLILCFQNPWVYSKIDNVDVVHYNPAETDIYEIFDNIYTKEYDRIVIDPLDALFVQDLKEVQNLLQNATLYLKSKGITGIFILNTSEYVGTYSMPSHMAHLVDTIIALKYAEIDFQLKRVMGILKARHLRYEPGLWEYTIKGGKVEIYGRVERISH